MSIKSFFRPYYHILTKGKSCGVILMLHRVDSIDDKKLSCNENMKITPEFLDSFILNHKNKYEYIKLADVPSRLLEKNKKPFICFTMDDGYKDNYTKAYPIFKKHNVPFTIFVTTSFPEYTSILWWYELEDLLLLNNELHLSNGMNFVCETKQQKEDTFMKIRELILKLDQTNLIKELNFLFSEYKIDWTSKCESLCMSWNDINIINSDPLVTIGGHTAHHYNLKQLDVEKNIITEIQEGLDLLKQKANIVPKVFAYPFGSASEAGIREFEIIDRMGFSLGCIAYGGYTSKKNLNNLFALPRVMLTHNFNDSLLE